MKLQKLPFLKKKEKIRKKKIIQYLSFLKEKSSLFSNFQVLKRGKSSKISIISLKLLP